MTPLQIQQMQSSQIAYAQMQAAQTRGYAFASQNIGGLAGLGSFGQGTRYIDPPTVIETMQAEVNDWLKDWDK